jgi:quercetin dioxygenase-like cupin family protein
MTWKIIEHTDDHICVMFADGSCLNYNVRALIEPPQKTNSDPLEAGASGPRFGGIAYRFNAGAVLPTHTHDTPETLHTIECVQGRVLVRREQGDVTLAAGEQADIKLGERHSVEALEPSKTVHWKNQ